MADGDSDEDYVESGRSVSRKPVPRKSLRDSVRKVSTPSWATPLGAHARETSRIV